MYPKSTTYRLVTESDEDRLLEYIREKMGIISHIGWPSIIAERNGDLLGCIITQAREDAVVCGPIYSENGIIAVRLLMIYEDYLAKMGIKEYLFSIADVESSDMLNLARRKSVPLVDLGENDGQHWYKRRIA